MSLRTSAASQNWSLQWPSVGNSTYEEFLKKFVDFRRSVGLRTSAASKNWNLEWPSTWRAKNKELGRNMKYLSEISKAQMFLDPAELKPRVPLSVVSRNQGRRERRKRKDEEEQ